MKEIRKLKKMSACRDALVWLKKQESYTLGWKNCQRGDWMLWLLARTLDLSDETRLRQITLAKARCAKLVKHLMKDERSKKAVEIAEAFGNGKTTRNKLDTAAAAAYAAAAADIAAAAYAATAADIAAAYAATAAGVAAAAYTAIAAADVAAAAYAATAAAYADARQNTLSKCANIVREIFPNAPEI